MNMKLSRDEIIACHEAAVSHYKKQDFLNPAADSTWTKDKNLHELIAQYAEALGSEWVVAKYYGLPYDPMESKHKEAADVGARFEIKWTRYDQGQLIVSENDRPQDIAILVVGSSPKYRIAGWIPIAMARKERHRHRIQTTWWVTQANLQPIETLARSIYAHTGV
jgi:hypothetical protein